MTNYVIKTTGGFYYKNGVSEYHWTIEIDKAKKYNFMTSAIAYATLKLDLSPNEYTIEAI